MNFKNNQMRKKILPLLILLIFKISYAQNDVNHQNIKEDLHAMLNDISQYYAYFEDKDVEIDCLLEYYEAQIPNIKTEEETVLFFEYLLDEFYDNHVMLNTNRESSYRIHSPIYVTIKNNKPIISNVWQTHIENIDQNIIGAEVLKINGIHINTAITEFPTHCHNKKSIPVREWIVNKLVSGRYNQSRMLSLKTVDNKIIEFDIDVIKLKKQEELLATKIENQIGFIRINNSLGNNKLVSEFDKSLKKLEHTKGLIIDLRNTVSGGNSYVARGIMGRFIKQQKPYQKHQILEKYDDHKLVERTWIEYVTPRGTTYTKPVVILVGRWTGSMGEGLAIGFEGMERAKIVGTEMERLAGEMTGFYLKHQDYSYQLSFAKLYHINGTPREKYIPTYNVPQTTTNTDEVLTKGIELINENHIIK